MKHHNSENPNVYRGLAPFLDNDPSHKELFDMGLPWDMVSEDHHKYKLVEKTPFPEGQEYRWIVDGYEKFYNLFHRLSLKLLNYLAVGLGKEKGFFDAWFEYNSLCTFRSIYYLPREHQNAAKSDKLDSENLKLTTPEHADSGFLTLLTTFGYPGLQVEIDGEYKSIKPKAGCLVVNLGETFQRITNFKMKATMHRVLDIGEPRYSSPFFMDPRYDAVIPSNMLLPEAQQVEPPITYGPWLMKNMVKKYVEWQGFDDEL
jgi:isopenicillin N synthase-like dioxygenase